MADTHVGSDEVCVETVSQRRFGQWLAERADDLTPLLAELKRIDVVPGDPAYFPHARWMRETVAARRDALLARLSELRTGLVDISQSVARIADRYDTAEDAAAVRAEELTK